MEIVARPITISDSELILTWRNSPSARYASQKSNEIGVGEHESWFHSRVSRVAFEPFWIMSRGEMEIGYVRLDLRENEESTFVISIYVVPESRGMGFGKEMLRFAINSAVENQAISSFYAVINKSNHASIKIFEFFGFEFFANIDEKFCEYLLSSDKIVSNALNL